MSGIGGAFYEIGLAAAVFIIVPVCLVFQIKKEERMTLLAVVLGTILVYINTFNFATPYYAVLMGILAFKLREVVINETAQDYSSDKFKAPAL